MKKLATIVFLFLTYFSYSQEIVVDPVLIGTLNYTHSEQQQTLNNIQDSEDRIAWNQTLIYAKMAQIHDLQNKTYNYLSTVQSYVKNIKDIAYATEIASDIFDYQIKASDLAGSDPKLLLIVTKTEYELVNRSADLFLHIYQVALKDGEKNLLDNKQRIDLCTHVVDELRAMRGLAYSVYRQMRFGSKNFAKALSPGTFRYAVNMQSKVNQILNDATWIKKKL